MTKVVFFIVAAILSTSLFAQDSTHAAEAARTAFTLSAGASLPIGDFGTGGGRGDAQTGAALSAEFAVGGSTTWISSVLVSYNPSDAGVYALPDSPGGGLTIDPWWTIWPMTGIEWRSEASPSVTLALSGQVGCFVGISPWYILDYPPNGHASISSDRALAASFGAGAGVTVSDHYVVKLRYLHAKPGYDVTVTDLGFTTTSRENQSTSLLVLTLGWTW